MAFGLKKDGSAFTVLHSFHFPGGEDPLAGFIRDGFGNLFSTTWFGGDDGEGTVYKFENRNGQWIETILHSFLQSCSEGCEPEAGLTIDSNGNLFGTADVGGTRGRGIVFEVSP